MAREEAETIVFNASVKTTKGEYSSMRRSDGYAIDVDGGVVTLTRADTLGWCIRVPLTSVRYWTPKLPELPSEAKAEAKRK